MKEIFKNAIPIIIVFLIAMGLFILGGIQGYNSGFDDGKVKGKLEQLVIDTQTIQQMQDDYISNMEIYEPSKDEDINFELLKQIVESANKIDIDITASKDGYSEGVISIYFGNVGND